MNAILEKLRDQATELWNRVQETSLYMNLREKYESLNPRAQKGIIAGILVCAGLFLFSFPYSYLSSSLDNMTTFEENRDLIRNLLKASRTLREPSPLPPEVSTEMMSSSITRSLDEFHLVPEQVTPVQAINEKITNMVPDQVKQNAVSLQLKKLNLKQIVEISHRLQTLSPGTKVIGMDVRENQASHYFDVTYRIAAFFIPSAGGMDDDGRSGKKGGFKPPPKASAGDDDE